MAHKHRTFKSVSRRKIYQVIILWILYILNITTTECGKTATRVGLAGVAAASAGSSSASGDESNDMSSSFQEGETTRSIMHKNEMERIKYYLFVTKGYDKTIRPVLDETNVTRITLDFTLRQILDLDEKNQILKSYLWMRYSWTDELLTWNASDFEGIDRVWVPAGSIWRPDVILYEDTANRDYNPRLPYLDISSNGDILMAEPTVFESTCSINIALFPFDFQTCSLTFTSWAYPSSEIDVVSKKKREALFENIKNYFIKTGEWTVTDVAVMKASENYGTIAGGYTERERSDGNVMNNTLHIRKLMMDPTKFVKDVAPDRLTGYHWAYVKYTFLLQRNSSLYMQSMLFPAILLTTVALLGFYLPPDSGERIGLQITILLTFMVFLLTVGEMFPASTGPFIGVYFVMCMALLGVNLFMTVLVLHMHYMPSAAVMGKDENGEYTIKDVPKWIRFLLYIAKYDFRKEKKTTVSPTTQTVKNIMKTGKLSIQLSNADEMSMRDDLSSMAWSKRSSLSTLNPDKMQIGPIAEEKMGTSSECGDDDAQDQMVCTEMTSKSEQKEESPNNYENKGFEADETDEGKSDNTRSTAQYDEDKKEEQVQASGPKLGIPDSPILRQRSHHSSKREISYGTEGTDNKIYENLMVVLVRISHWLRKQDEQMREGNAGDDIENEWKAMARTIDKFCMKFYLFMLIAGHVAILATAIAQGSTYNQGIKDE